MGLCPSLVSLGPGDQHVGQTQSALLPLSIEQRGILGVAEKLSMDGIGGWLGSRNLSLHEMALGVHILQSPFPHLAPRCSFSFHAVYLSLGPGGGLPSPQAIT